MGYMTINYEKILPCPCCNGKGKLESKKSLLVRLKIRKRKYRIYCLRCGLSTKWTESIYQSKLMWNKRS